MSAYVARTSVQSANEYFRFPALTCWNDLSSDIIFAPSQSVFTQFLKAFFFVSYICIFIRNPMVYMTFDIFTDVVL